jgi:hypothetical protein
MRGSNSIGPSGKQHGELLSGRLGGVFPGTRRANLSLRLSSGELCELGCPERDCARFGILTFA